jgi:hypothetical protein
MEDKDVLEAFVLIDVLNEGPSPELPKTKTIKLKPNLEIKDPTFKKLRKRDKSANGSMSLSETSSPRLPPANFQDTSERRSRLAKPPAKLTVRPTRRWRLSVKSMTEFRSSTQRGPRSQNQNALSQATESQETSLRSRSSILSATRRKCFKRHRPTFSRLTKLPRTSRT